MEEERKCGWFSSTTKNIIYELKRLWFVLLISILIILPDDNRWIVAFALGCVTLTVIVAHLIRKTVWPYIDLYQLVKKAATTATGSAIVIAAVIYLMVAIIQSVLMFLKP